MRSKRTFGILLINSLVGLFLIFGLSTKSFAQVEPNSKSNIQAVQGEISGSFLTPESLTFDSDWNPQAYLFSTGSSTLIGFSSITIRSSSSYTSFPLFDCKKLFIHFFHTW